jgi:CcmD family protein
MRSSTLVGCVLVVVIVLGVAALSLGNVALASGAEDTAPSPQPGISGQQAEEGDSDPEANLPFLFAVYLITWAGFFGYTFMMSRRQREMRRELDALRTAIAEKEAESKT